MMDKPINLFQPEKITKASYSGRTFNKIKILEFVGCELSEGKIRHWYRAVCKCGNYLYMHGNLISKGRLKSCGCYTNPLRTGITKKYPREYTCWISMRSRCLNKKGFAYKYYGARGISISKRWDSFSNFLADMGPRPKGHSIDRINNNGNYTKENCRWATPAQQMINRSNIRKIKGFTFKDLSKITGITEDTLRSRYVAGWPFEKLVIGKKLTKYDDIKSLSKEAMKKFGKI